MVPIGDRPMLEYLVALLRQHGVTSIALNLHYKPDAIVKHFGNGSRFGVAIECSWESRLLGTAGAARRLARFLDEPFFVLYGDVLTNVDLTSLAQRHRATGATGSLLLYQPEDLTRCGVAHRAEDGRILKFEEKPTAPEPGGLAHAGISVFQPDVLDFIPSGRASDFGVDVYPQLIAAGHALYGYPTSEYILDIGSPARYAQARADLRNGTYRLPGRVDPPVLVGAG